MDSVTQWKCHSSNFNGFGPEKKPMIHNAIDSFSGIMKVPYVHGLRPKKRTIRFLLSNRQINFPRNRD